MDLPHRRAKPGVMFLQEHFSIFSLGEACNSCESVPAGTLDAFCTQIHRVHSKSPLHLKCDAHYAAQ